MIFREKKIKEKMAAEAIMVGKRKGKLISLAGFSERAKARPGKRKKKSAMQTTENPKKLVMRIEIYPRSKAGGIMESVVWEIFINTMREEIMRRRYEKRPTKPVVARKLRYSLWALL
jgi:hypothetical protein